MAGDRRDFLQSAGCFGMMVALFGVSSADAASLPISFIESTQAGQDRRFPMPAADGVNIDRSAQMILVRFQ